MIASPYASLNYNRPIALAEDIYWVGFQDNARGLHCNPYLIVDGTESLLIDGGSRPEFSIVMRKILQTGIAPTSITYLIYQHHDPDLCGSLPNFEEMIGRKDLKILSKKENNVFIRYYAVRSEMLCIDTMGHRLVLKSGRVLRFFPTPYAHAPGSFMTLDEKTGILFTSDLFGALNNTGGWSLYQSFEETCHHCTQCPGQDLDAYCEKIAGPCPWIGVERFHQEIMPNNRALRFAMQQVKKIKPRLIAPQHGSILYEADDINMAIQRLSTLEQVGIDGIQEESHE